AVGRCAYGRIGEGRELPRAVTVAAGIRVRVRACPARTAARRGEIVDAVADVSHLPVEDDVAALGVDDLIQEPGARTAGPVAEADDVVARVRLGDQLPCRVEVPLRAIRAEGQQVRVALAGAGIGQRAGRRGQGGVEPCRTDVGTTSTVGREGLEISRIAVID